MGTIKKVKNHQTVVKLFTEANIQPGLLVSYDEEQYDLSIHFNSSIAAGNSEIIENFALFFTKHNLSFQLGYGSTGRYFGLSISTPVFSSIHLSAETVQSIAVKPELQALIKNMIHNSIQNDEIAPSSLHNISSLTL